MAAMPSSSRAHQLRSCRRQSSTPSLVRGPQRRQIAARLTLSTAAATQRPVAAAHLCLP